MRRERVPEKNDEVDPAFGDAGANLLIAAERTASEPRHAQAGFFGDQATGCSGAVELVAAQRAAIVFRPLEDVLLEVVMRDKGDAFTGGHPDNTMRHVIW